MDASRDQETIEALFEIWSTGRDKSELEEKLFSWFDAGDAAHVRAAMAAVRGNFSQRFATDFGKQIAGAIDRIAEQDQLNALDMYYLDLVGKENAPNAPSHAVQFLNHWLDHPKDRLRQSEILGMQRSSALTSSVNIIARAPEFAKQVDTRKAGDQITKNDADQLSRLTKLYTKGISDRL